MEKSEELQENLVVRQKVTVATHKQTVHQCSSLKCDRFSKPDLGNGSMRKIAWVLVR